MRAIPIPIVALLLVSACASAPAPGSLASTQGALAPSLAAEPRDSAPPLAAKQPIPDGAFIEGPQSRDPFRAYPPAPPAPPIDARPRKAKRIPIDQLKLVALVTHTATPRAMLVDPSGRGWIVTQGELVGRPEPVSAAAGDESAAYASFRVDRIREGDVVLVREDGSNARGPAATRVLSLPREPLLQADD